MSGLVFVLLASLGLSHAADDSDAKRTIPDGQERYTGENLTVGGVYEGFVIRFPNRDELFLSPSRCQVSYGERAFACRNASEFPVPANRAGLWYKVSFEVLALKESAVETPEGSGNWTWKVAFDCDIKTLVAAS